MELSETQCQIENELESLELELRGSLVSRLPLITDVANHLLSTRGKRFRPTLLLLSAKLNGAPSDRAVRAATIVEIIHTATLIHDDSIDKSRLRRGFPTVNSLWDNDVSIAMGDFLYSKAFHLLVENKMYDVIEILAEATHRMSVGEMLELEKRHDTGITEEEYMSMIGDKTASLISACCEIGAVLGDSHDGTKSRFSRYGHSVGLAFQITDDLFDFVGHESDLGKDVASDVRGGKFTLPVITALRNAGSMDKAKMQNILSSDGLVDGRWEELVSLIREYDGIAYARQVALAHASEAKNTMKPFEDSPCYSSLCSIVDYTVERRQ
ncbi:MAG: polyprenyl synthetase family protein [Candidatus Eisenbacteria bacterium]